MSDGIVDKADLFDLLYIPGGIGSGKASLDPAMLGLIRRHYEAGKVVASNCSGIGILARSGILGDNPVTCAAARRSRSASGRARRRLLDDRAAVLRADPGGRRRDHLGEERRPHRLFRRLGGRLATLRAQKVGIDALFRMDAESPPFAMITAPDLSGARIEYVDIADKGPIEEWVRTGRFPGGIGQS